MNSDLAEIINSRMCTGDGRVLRTVREWTTEAGQFTAFYFRSEVSHGGEVPVYAVLGIPLGQGPFPGVLHYHGGGQSAWPHLVEALVRYGYAAISFDWTGPFEEREHVTRWPESDVRYSAVTPDESYLIRALNAARQCLNLLVAHPKVDGERLGEFGISWGGLQTWLLNAVDDRLKAAIAIYGCGITPGQASCYFRDEVKRFGGFDEKRWFELFHPENYAHSQHAPVLFINGTNDFFGWMNTYRQLAGKLDSRHRCAFAPHISHGVAALNPTILSWLDHHLRGRAFPQATQLEVVKRMSGLVVRSPQLAGAESAKFFVAAGKGVGPDYFWQPIPAVLKAGVFTAQLPATALTSPKAMVFAHQWLENGVESSSIPVRVNRVVNSTSRSARTRREVHFPLTPDLWYGRWDVDPFYPYSPLSVDVSRLGLECTADDSRNQTYQFNTRLVVAPPYRPLPGDQFCCRLEGPIQDPINLAVSKYTGSPREQRFQMDFPAVALAQGIQLKELKDTAGKGLRNAAGISHLCLSGRMSDSGRVRLMTAGWQQVRTSLPSGS